MTAARRATVAIGLTLWSASHLAAAGEVIQTSRDDLARGEQLYARACASCHGPAGEGGRGPALAVPKLFRAPDNESLERVIRRGIEGGGMPGTRFTDVELRQVAAWVHRLGESPVEEVRGDPRRGEQLYLVKGGCASCHAIKGRGGAFGPDLTHIGRRRGASHLRASVVNPEADVPKSFSAYRSDVNITQNFLLVHVTTNDGREFTGARVNEDSFSIQIRDPAGRLHSFFKSELARLQKQWGRSPMPSFGSVFSEQELDDLVAFMATLRGE